MNYGCPSNVQGSGIGRRVYYSEIIKRVKLYILINGLLTPEQKGRLEN